MPHSSLPALPGRSWMAKPCNRDWTAPHDQATRNSALSTGPERAMSARIVNDASSLGSYSPAVVAGGFCYVAGQGPVDRNTREIVHGDIDIEASRTLENLS